MIEVLVATVTTVGLIVVAVISNRGRQHAKAARDQVQNSHNTNLRDELDSRHRENVSNLTRLMKWQATHEVNSSRRDARIARVEILLLPTIVAAILNTVIHIIRKR